MKKHRIKFYLVLLTLTLIFLLSSFFIQLFVFKTIKCTNYCFIPFFIASIIYICLFLLLSFKSGKLYDLNYYNLQRNTKDFENKLIDFGKIPLKVFISFIIIGLIFVLANKFIFDWLKIEPSIINHLLLIMLSLVFLTAAFIYTLSDIVIFKTLKSYNLQYFPRGYNKSRQVLKIAVVPFFMCLTTYTFTTGSKSLFLIIENNYFTSGNILAATKILFPSIYFAFLTILFYSWTDETASLFKNLKVQLHALTSEENKTVLAEIAELNKATEQIGISMEKINLARE